MTLPPESLESVKTRVVRCTACPRLVAWREQVAADRRAAYATETYWGRAVPGFGDPCAHILVVGLAPAAHGANRTGRMFTGDRSGDWLYRALHRAGLANQPTSTSRDDGLTLRNAYVTAVVRCAPPGNRPTPAERNECLHYLEEEMAQLPARVVVCLGAFAWDGVLRALPSLGADVPRPRPSFTHGAEVSMGPWVMLGSYHPSQQNTFTGRLTETMFDEIFSRACVLAQSK
jgi:uracil-DNA glycosylase family 4